MQHHQILFQEAKFRADIAHLGDPQSNTLTLAMIAESAANGLIAEHATILHHHITFLTSHDTLMDKLAGILTTNHTWDSFTMPFGRLPTWLINPDHTHGPANVDPLPLYWDRVQPPGGPGHDLTVHDHNHKGCYHLFPPGSFVPEIGDGGVNIGQYPCSASLPTTDGFIDKRCELDSDYGTISSFGLNRDMELDWHDAIHPFVGGDFAPMALTGGTVAFWGMHTFASSIVLSN